MKQILVVYHSQERGNTRKMAELVADGCRGVEGVEVEAVNANEARVDMGAAEAADAYAIGSPDYFSYVAGGIKQFFDDLLIAKNQGRSVGGKPCVLFLTHGGGGKAVDSLERLANSLKLVKAADTLSCKGAPEAKADVDKSTGLGRALAEQIVKAK